MKKRLVQALKFLAFLSVGVLLLWLAFRQTDYRKLYEDLLYADYSWVFLAMLFGIAGYVIRARRWILLINPLGYKPSMSSTYHAVMTGYLANIMLPRLGELTRCIALGKKEKIPVDQLVGTVIIERTVDLVCLLSIMVVVIFTSGDRIVELLNESIFYPLRDKLINIFGSTWIMWAVLAFLGTVGLFLVIRYRRRLRKIQLFSRMFDIARGVINGLKTITNLERKGEFIFQTVLLWLSYAMQTWVAVFAIESTSGVNFGEGIFLLVIGGLAMSAPVQGGFGVFHYAISRALVILENVPIEDGLAYAVLTHESQLVWVALAGTISFLLIFRKNRKQELLHTQPEENQSNTER